jgi:hypothetical protein
VIVTFTTRRYRRGFFGLSGLLFGVAQGSS